MAKTYKNKKPKSKKHRGGECDTIDCEKFLNVNKSLYIQCNTVKGDKTKLNSYIETLPSTNIADTELKESYKSIINECEIPTEKNTDKSIIYNNNNIGNNNNNNSGESVIDNNSGESVIDNNSSIGDNNSSTKKCNNMIYPIDIFSNDDDNMIKKKINKIEENKCYIIRISSLKKQVFDNFKSNDDIKRIIKKAKQVTYKYISPNTGGTKKHRKKPNKKRKTNKKKKT